MKKKILALSLVLAMTASVLSPAAMAQTASESLLLTIVTSESTPTNESSSVSESTSTSESVATSESTATSESVAVSESAPVSESIPTNETVSADESAANQSAEAKQGEDVAIDETNFPDAAFREYIQSFDSDQNGVLSQQEIAQVTYISASDSGIESLKGVEHFTSISSLFVSRNNLKELDLSRNTALKNVSAYQNPLAALQLGAQDIALSVSDPAQVSLVGTAGQGVDLKAYAPSFDASKVSNLQGAKLDENGVLTEWVSGKIITYTYDAGFGQALNVQVMVEDAASIVTIDEASFPDAIFREYVKQFDYNADGQLSASEYGSVRRITVYWQEVTTLKGIEYFPNLEKLDASGCKLEELDVSANVELTHLRVGTNQLKALDVGKCPKLEELDVSYNYLTELDVTNNPALVSLSVDSGSTVSYDSNWNPIAYNQLQTLDVSNQPELTSLKANGNLLTALDVSQNPKLQTLEVARNQLTQLDLHSNPELQTLNLAENLMGVVDVSSNAQLTDLNVAANALTQLDVTHNPKLKNLVAGGYSEYDRRNQLKELNLSANTELESLDVDENLLSSLDISNNLLLTNLSAENNGLTALDVTKHTQLRQLSVTSNQLKTLDVSNNTQLEWLQAASNQLSKMDVTKNTKLNWLDVSNNQLSELDISQNASLYSLSASSNQLKALDVAANEKLTSLYVSENKISAIDVSRNVLLEYLSLGGNHLTSIDVSKNPQLYSLNVYDNELTELDVTNNKSLTTLSASGNKFTEIDLSQNEYLENLQLYDNQLKTIDLSHNPALWSVSLGNNQLTFVDLSAQTQLRDLSLYGNPLAAFVTGGSIQWLHVDNPVRLSFDAKTGEGVDLKAYAPGFDSAKVKNLQGAKLDENGVLTDWVSGSPISYTYDAGFGQMLNVIVTVTDDSLQGLTLTPQPFVKTYDGKAVSEAEIVAGAAAADSGKEVAGVWTVQNFTELKDAGVYRATLLFTPNDSNYQSGTIDTVVQINPAPLAVYPLLSSNRVGTSDPLPTVTLGYRGLVNGESLSASIVPVFEGMPKTNVPGYHNVKIANQAELLADLQAQPTARNYTITVSDVTSLYIANMITIPAPLSPVPGTTGRLDLEETFTNVPDSLKAIGLDTPEKVTEKLLASTKGANASNTVVYDVHYTISEDNQTWNALTPEQFPKAGLTITLPYPQGVDTTANDFTAMHMFTQDMNGFKTGDVEVLSAVKTTQGLQITVKGFSPIAITWKASANPTPPTDGGIVTPPTVPTTPTTTGPIAQTGDNSQIALWAVLMVVCAAGIAGLVFVRIKNQKK